MARVKISAAYRDFEKEMKSLSKLDEINQKETRFSKNQIELLSEGLFMSAFRAYENYIEEIFLLATLEKPCLSGKKPKSFLKPKTYNHSRDLIRSSMPFLDWSTPNTVIERSQTYLKEGYPLCDPISASTRILADMKILRNQIAHNSDESRKSYGRMLLRTYGTLPLGNLSPGRHLLNSVPRLTPNKHYLAYYIANLKNIGEAVAQ
ncbi:MAG: hypothetical protein ABGX87_12245 [Alcanivorax sp.]|uniref:hypothetical protein n=1 Tax=Alloalcanivorax marinus TaxID=1177169 RepID=UPI001958FB22|nr:hypothetical protein [Alloalcanivorax marinus]MBM7332851.1 hypothetical protein [Alloalcanivorax marinus]